MPILGSTFFVSTATLDERNFNRELKIYGLYDKNREMFKLVRVKYHDSDYPGVPLDLAKEVLKQNFIHLAMPNTYMTYIPS